MADYIDKNELYKKGESLLKSFINGKKNGEQAFRDLFNAIADMPTVEQKHGHWQIVKECEAYFNECSNCKSRLWEVEPEWIFCPYCACKMDEVTEDE